MGMPAQSPITMDIMDILPTVDIMDGVDTMDTHTDTGNVMLKLHLLPLLLQLLMLMPAPNLITTDTTDILTDTGSVKQLLLKKLNMPSKNDLLMPKLMPALNLITTDTTDIPTDTEDTTDTDTTDIVTDTVTDTMVRFSLP